MFQLLFLSVLVVDFTIFLWKCTIVIYFCVTFSYETSKKKCEECHNLLSHGKRKKTKINKKNLMNQECLSWKYQDKLFSFQNFLILFTNNQYEFGCTFHIFTRRRKWFWKYNGVNDSSLIYQIYWIDTSLNTIFTQKFSVWNRNWYLTVYFNIPIHQKQILVQIFLIWVKVETLQVSGKKWIERKTDICFQITLWGKMMFEITKMIWKKRENKNNEKS